MEPSTEVDVVDWLVECVHLIHERLTDALRYVVSEVLRVPQHVYRLDLLAFVEAQGLATLLRLLSSPKLCFSLGDASTDEAMQASGVTPFMVGSDYDDELLEDDEEDEVCFTFAWHLHGIECPPTCSQQ
jgi:hypothetical protein